jgi:hypothetical protein
MHSWHNVPFFESRNTFVQVSSGLEFRVLDLNYLYVGQRMVEESAEMRWEVCESVVATLHDSMSISAFMIDVR